MEFGSFCNSYLWTLHNFSKLGVTEEEVKTPSLKFAGIRWLMKLNICEICDNGDFTIIPSLVIETDGVHKPKLYWRITLVAEDGTRFLKKECEMQCLKPENLPAFAVSRSSLERMDTTKLLPYDCLTIRLDLVALDRFTCQASWESFKANEWFEPDHGLKSLSRDIFSLFDKKRETDVELHVGNQSFPAHKLILGARSNAFERVFFHDAKRKKHVYIGDIEACDVKLMLEYIYSGTDPEIPTDRVPFLSKAALKYGVRDLQRKCIQLKGKISADNVENIRYLERQINLASEKWKTNISRDLPKKFVLQLINKLIDYFMHGLSYALFFSFLIILLSFIFIPEIF